MIIKRDSNDILHFLIKNKKNEYTLNELSQELLIPKRNLSAMLIYLRCQGYIKYRREKTEGFYSLINV